ncbi:hypothetical protein CC1G_09574 [Coprinopsis cinerea okayama7|uniref:DUF6533 domain-containing protein n=1 Tax=Coprinopsis cinerea (strain Okayama-7 / 130 / ATCC MYA-4618 / FGSC 9003) TaxID=240176 RepID=A8P983_COPC7|nr:hypothetical protein CC1G_09574 [Coprinopsis cinerea okayama7\|eukprot:XP_001839719.2 hypothetical protein CC1G_09574 [Coprinopsis cinerea okayama7\
MSEPLPFEHDPVSTARDILLHNLMHFLAITCLYYDHFITLGPEIELLWSRRKSPSSYWFFLNRYFAFFGNLCVSILGFIDLDKERYLCSSSDPRLWWVIFVYLWTQPSQGPGSAAHASDIRPLPTFKTYSRLHVDEWSHPSRNSMCLAGAWEALFAYDSIIFTLTLWKTIKERRERRVTGVNIALVDILLRDGAMYYAIMALCNLANIMTFYFGGPFFRGSLSTFASSISVTMMSRLMLNLHRTAEEGIHTTQVTNTHFDYGTKYWETQSPVELDTIWTLSGPSLPTVTFQDPPGSAAADSATLAGSVASPRPHSRPP